MRSSDPGRIEFRPERHDHRQQRAREHDDVPVGAITNTSARGAAVDTAQQLESAGKKVRLLDAKAGGADLGDPDVIVERETRRHRKA